MQGYRVSGLRRQPPETCQDIHFYRADVARVETLAVLAGAAFDQLLYILSPPGRLPADYHRVFVEGLDSLLTHVLPLNPGLVVTLVSSTRVYGHASSPDRVGLTTPLSPDDPCADILCQAEAMVSARVRHVNIVRFSGIYGPGRLHWLRCLRAGKTLPGSPGQWTNRIHRDDCIGFLCHLMTSGLAILSPEPSVFLATDDCPVQTAELADWLGRYFHLPLPESPQGGYEASGRRIDNVSMKATGYRLRYPGYREGYAALPAGEVDRLLPIS